jgi:hypothetical protein
MTPEDELIVETARKLMMVQEGQQPNRQSKFSESISKSKNTDKTCNKYATNEFWCFRQRNGRNNLILNDYFFLLNFILNFLFQLRQSTHIESKNRSTHLLSIYCTQ